MKTLLWSSCKTNGPNLQPNLNLKYIILDQQYIRTIKSIIQQQKDTTYHNLHDKLFEELNPEAQHYNRAMDKLRGIFLALTMAMKAIGYTINKQEFKAYHLHGIWMEDKLHTHFHCICGKTNSVDHNLICKLGGYTSMKNNSVKNSEAQIMRNVYRNVQIKVNHWKCNWKKSQCSWQCSVGYFYKRTAEQLWENFLWHMDHTSHATS